MRPVLKQPTLPAASPSGRVDQRTVIGSETREGRQVVGSDQDIDAVDLVKGEPVDGPQPSRGGDSFRARAAEALGCKSDPPRLGERELFHFGVFAPSGNERGASGARGLHTCSISISVPAKSFGCKNRTGLPWAPIFGSPSPSTRAPLALSRSRAAMMSA